MRHLSPETLARLVDESPDSAEREHLASCPACTAELDALTRQTEALASLPDLRPPAGDWKTLQRRLAREGLIRAPRAERGAGVVARLTGSGWLQAAAAVVLFLGGAGVGAAAAGGGTGAGDAGVGAPGTPASLASVESVDDASQILREAERRYVSALTRYRELAEEEGVDEAGGDPASRYAALEALVAAGQAAVRRAPTDPFINGVLASTMAERQATLRRISSSSTDRWY